MDSCMDPSLDPCLDALLIRAQTISVNKRYPIAPDESLSLLEPALQMIVPNNIHLEFDLKIPVNKKICCAINDFEMIILNLVKNSVDAISEKGGLANKGWSRVQSEWVSVNNSLAAGITDDQMLNYYTLILHVGFDEKKHGYINPYNDLINDYVNLKN